MKVSVFPVYIVWARFREQFWSCNGTVNFCFLNSHNVRLVKIKEASSSNFLPLMLLMFVLTNFSPPIKLFLLVPNEEDLFSFLLSVDQIYFHFLSLTAHQKRIRKVEKITFWANPGTVCISQSFILRSCDERASIVNPHLTIVTLMCLVIFQNSTAA